MAGDDALDVLDADAPGLALLQQVAQHRLGHLDRDRRAGQLVVGDEAVRRALEIAPVGGDGAGDEVDHRLRHLDTGEGDALGGEALGEDAPAQLCIRRHQFHQQTAGEARAHPRVEGLELARRPVAGDHHLAGAVDQGVEGVAELGLAAVALQELHVVDDQEVDLAQRVLEVQRRVGLQGGDEAVHEVLGGEIEHPPAAVALRLAGDRLQEVRLAEADRRLHEQGVERHRLARTGAGDLPGGGERQRIRAPFQERVEGEARVERRAGEGGLASPVAATRVGAATVVAAALGTGGRPGGATGA